MQTTIDYHLLSCFPCKWNVWVLVWISVVISEKVSLSVLLRLAGNCNCNRFFGSRRGKISPGDKQNVLIHMYLAFQHGSPNQHPKQIVSSL
ncbi:hypothetical protein XELAEV_18011919mg [Xenopus laevis]|uniref:Uncharacterized protein n=1 Tax=Xenopus laevis TaxID=8355 RepID=A0A974DNZ7_XENLA|nr:hypothetical protein XELAEV_18011919mg [Xenopus laevis]